jgi:hypothetical protein
MSDALRRLYNRVDGWFDRAALVRDVQVVRGLQEPAPVTARRAFEQAARSAREMDRAARLKMISAPGGVDASGASDRWEFLFDLPARRAKLSCTWFLEWDAQADRFGAAQIDAQARPFPPMDSPLRRLVAEGKLLHRQMIGLWAGERRRGPDLPDRFRDSNEVIGEFMARGLDVALHEFTLGTGLSPAGEISWVVHARGRSDYVRFAK